MAAPKLRFKEFDGDWIKSKLGSEAQFFQGEQVSLDDQCSEYAHGLIKFLRIENFTQKSKDFRYIRYTGSQEKILVEQDIAIVRYGATAGFICSGETGVIANNLFKVSVDNKKINQKYELLLKYVYSEKTIQIQLADLNRLYLVLFWCEDIKEFNMLLSKAVELNHLKLKFDGMSVKEYIITYDGKEFIENLGLDNNSNKVFMAFHFTEEMKKEFELTIKRAVFDSSEGKLEAVRVSSSTTDHDAKIDDELIGMIKSSKAVIADFTGNRTAVYYEAGFAMGLGIPVIWTCKDENIIEGEEGYGKFIDKEGKERFKKHIDL